MIFDPNEANFFDPEVDTLVSQFDENVPKEKVDDEDVDDCISLNSTSHMSLDDRIKSLIQIENEIFPNTR